MMQNPRQPSGVHKRGFRKHRMQRRFPRLSPMENQVLDYYLDGNGYTEIAKIMGKTPKSIDNALQRIRGKIKEQLEKYRK